MEQEYTVSELAFSLKRTLEQSFGAVHVRGELSGIKIHSSGHLYGTLKDENAVIDLVCWRGTVQKLPFTPQEGMEVICHGKITTYPGRSKYQIVLENVELAGEGALLKLLEERKRNLAAEGLFETSRKKQLPFLPRAIGVITSPTGAVIRDILHRLNARFPRDVFVWPVLVQGPGAADQISAAVQGFNQLSDQDTVPRPDLLIVARGGGSLEDLWCFNEENVVRAVANSDIPVISAVGHETDTTLVDYAADRRAPTPTAAAEIAVPVAEDLKVHIAEQGRRLHRNADQMITSLEKNLLILAQRAPSLEAVVDEKTQRLDDLFERLFRATANFSQVADHRLKAVGGRLHPPYHLLEHRKMAFKQVKSLFEKMGTTYFNAKVERLNNLGGLLKSYSYKQTLARGFALVKDEAGKPVTRKKTAEKIKTPMEVVFQDGALKVIAPPPKSIPKMPKPRKSSEETKPSAHSLKKTQGLLWEP